MSNSPSFSNWSEPFDPVDRPRSRPSDFSRGGRAEELHGSALVRGNSIAGLVFGSGLPHKLQGEIHSTYIHIYIYIYV